MNYDKLKKILNFKNELKYYLLINERRIKRVYMISDCLRNSIFRQNKIYIFHNRVIENLVTL